MSQVAGWITHRYLKFAVIVFWLVVVALLGPLAGKLTGAQGNDAKSWLPARRGVDRGARRRHRLRVLQHDPRGHRLRAHGGPHRRRPGRGRGRRRGVRHARHARRRGRSARSRREDGEAAQIIVPLDLGTDGWNLAADAVDDLRATAEDGADGMDVYITGPAGRPRTRRRRSRASTARCCSRPSAVVIIILLLTYRSPILWLLPVISAGVALTVSQAVIYLLADNAGLTVNAQSAGILTVLVFGAGTDYALLLIARYREELRKHGDRHEAMALALHRASPAIIASGATVAIGMLCLLFATMNSTAGLGPVAAIGIVVAVLVMLTLLPALLVTCGRWVFWPRAPKLGDAEPSEHGFWSRVGGRIERRPRRTWVVTSAILRRRVLRRRRAQRERPDQRGVVHLRAAVHRGREGARRALPRRRRLAGRGHREHRPGRRRGRRLRRRRGHRPDQRPGAGRTRTASPTSRAR